MSASRASVPLDPQRRAVARDADRLHVEIRWREVIEALQRANAIARSYLEGQDRVLDVVVGSKHRRWTAEQALGLARTVLIRELRELGIRVCSGCGCTDQFGCPSSCSWIAPERCSACGPVRARRV